MKTSSGNPKPTHSQQGAVNPVKHQPLNQYKGVKMGQSGSVGKPSK
jgi:hypothetical protein